MTLSAVLLAGGESRRMGSDKALIEFEGAPLWERQLATLRAVKSEKIFLSARIDPPWRPNDVEFVPDSGESHGPLSGIAATLDKISTSHLLVLAIDMRFMTAHYLRSLGEHATNSRGVVPRIGERFEPLAAVYPREVDVDLARALRGDDFSLQRILTSLIAAGKIMPLDVAPIDAHLFRNLNEPSDLAACVTRTRC